GAVLELADGRGANPIRKKRTRALVPSRAVVMAGDHLHAGVLGNVAESFPTEVLERFESPAFVPPGEERANERAIVQLGDVRVPVVVGVVEKDRRLRPRAPFVTGADYADAPAVGKILRFQ